MGGYMRLVFREKSLRDAHQASADHGGIETMSPSLDVAICGSQNDLFDIFAKCVDVLSNSSLRDGAFYNALEGVFPGWMRIDQATRGDSEVFVFLGSAVIARIATGDGIHFLRQWLRKKALRRNVITR
jgi:hypothetical protein